MSEVLKWLEEESDRLTEESLSSADPHKTVNNSFLEGFDYALANVQGLDQPQLNDNQQIVLDYLKDKCNLYSFIAYKPFEAIIRLSMLDPEKNELRVINTIDELTYKQQAQVLEVFSRWASEQEEE